jgi:hypothetical protein
MAMLMLNRGMSRKRGMSRRLEHPVQHLAMANAARQSVKKYEQKQ